MRRPSLYKGIEKKSALSRHSRTVGIAAVAGLVLSLIGGFLVSPAAGVAHTVFVVSAWSYNLGLKRTMFSLVPYLVSFGLLPSIVTLAVDPPAWSAWWATLAGAGLGLSAHLANVLPDFDDDAKTGVRGFPHRLGAKASGIVAFAALLLSSAVIAVNVQSVAGYLCLAVVAIIAIYGVSLVLRRRLGRILFLLILISALSRPSAPRPSLLSDLFGLSIAEGAVALALLGGQTAESVARERDVSLETVRSQIRTVLRKTDAANLRDFERIGALLANLAQ